MVNSKKMSKSTVAIVLLSLLLVLSLILTATGAWFTATDNKSTQEVKMTFGNLSVTGSVTDLEVKLDGTKWTKAAETQIVMPGDMVRGGVYTFTITTNDSEGAYYLLKSGDKYYTVGDNNALTEYTSGALTAVATNGTATITFGGIGEEGSYVGGAEGSKILNKAQNGVLTISSGEYTIYVIQASNISASSAASTIQNLVDGTDGYPKNYAAQA